MNWITFTRGDCELDHIHPRVTGARWGSPDGASRFQCPGVGKVAWRYTALAALFFVPGPLAAVPPHGPCGEDADQLSESKKASVRKCTKAAGIFPSFAVLNFDRPHRTIFQPSKAESAADLDRANVPTGARMHTLPHRVAAVIVVIGIAVGVIRIAVVAIMAVIIGVVAVPSKSAPVVKPMVEVTTAVEATAMESATCHGPTVKSATAKSGCAAKTTRVETAATKTAAVETASAKTASAVEAAPATKAASTAKAATAVAPAATTTTAGQGNSRCKHANRGSCNQGDDCFTQHKCTP